MSMGDRIGLIIIGTIIAVIVKLIEGFFKRHYSFIRAKSFLMLFAKDLKNAIQENNPEVSEATYKVVLINYPDFNSNIHTQESIEVLLNFYNKLILREFYKNTENQEHDIEAIRKVETLIGLNENTPFSILIQNAKESPHRVKKYITSQSKRGLAKVGLLSK